MSNRVFANMEYPPQYYTSIIPSDLVFSGDGGWWYDFGDWNNMFTDTAMTTKVTAAGQQVAAVKDKSVNGRHIFQATASKRPVSAIDGNGFKCLDFTASAVQCMLSSNAGTALAQHWGCMMFSRDTTTIFQRLWACSTSGNDTATANDIAVTAGGTDQHMLIRAGAATTDAYVPGTGLSPLAFYEYEHVGALTSVWKNGVPGVNDSSSFALNNFSTGKNCIGVQGVNNATGTAGAFDGKMYQLLHCGTIPTESQKDAVQAWFETYRF